MCLGVVLCLCLVAASLLPCLAAPTTAYDIYTQARFDLLDEKYPDALAKVEQALDLQPDDPRFIYLKLDILRELKRPRAAIAFLKTLLARDPQKLGYLAFDLGYLYVSRKQYEPALEQFKWAERVDRQRSLREQALLYMRMRKYHQALELIKQLDQDQVDTKYLLAQALYQNQQFDQAREAVARALAMKPSPRQARDLKGLQEVIDAAQRAARPWQASLSLAVQYDDNVLRNPLQDNPALSLPGGKGDYAVRTVFNFGYRLYQAGTSQAGLTAALGSINYFDLTDSNYAYWTLGGYYSYQAKSWGVRVPFDFSYYHAGGALSSQLSAYTLAPVLYWDMTASFRTEFNGTLQRRIYFSDESNITRWGLGLTHYYYIRKPLTHIRLGYRLDQDLADDDRSGYLAYQLLLGGAVPLWGPLSLDLALTYTHYDHDRRPEFMLRDAQGNYGVPFERKDDQYGVLLQIFYTVNRQCQLVLGYSYTYNDSNLNLVGDVDPYNFRQNLVWLMLNYAF